MIHPVESSGRKSPKKTSALVYERLSHSEWGRKTLSEFSFKEPNTEEWNRYQKEAFTQWINFKLADAPEILRRDNLIITDLYTDMRSGLILFYLTAILSRGAILSLGKPHHIRENKASRFLAMQNISMVLSYLQQFLSSERMQLPDASDIVEGKPNAVLSLVWWIITHYNGVNGFDSTPSFFKSTVLAWATRRAKRIGLEPSQPQGSNTTEASSNKHNDVHSRAAWQKGTSQKQDKNYFQATDPCVQDGRLFLALLHVSDPTRFSYCPTGNSENDLRTAFDACYQAYNIPKLLDAKDPQCMKQEDLVLTYLSELRIKLPRHSRTCDDDDASSVLEESIPRATRNTGKKKKTTWPPAVTSTSPGHTVESSPKPISTSKRSNKLVDAWPPYAESAEKKEAKTSTHEVAVPQDAQVISPPIAVARAVPRCDRSNMKTHRRDRYVSKPSRAVFERAAATLVEDARTTTLHNRVAPYNDDETLAKKSSEEDSMQLRRLRFAEYLSSTITAEGLDILWEAREAGSRRQLEIQLEEIGVDRPGDRLALVEILSDPFAMGEAPPAPPTESFWETLFFSDSTHSQRNDTAKITEHLALPLAVRGLGQYVKRIAGHAAALWRAREEGAFRGLEAALEDESIFGLAESNLRCVLARLLLEPVALPYHSNLVDELVGRGLESAVSFGCDHEAALCAARDLGDRAAVLRVAKCLRGFEKSTNNQGTKSQAFQLSQLAAVICDRRRILSWRDRFDPAAARPSALKARASLVWLRAKARRGIFLVRNAQRNRPKVIVSSSSPSESTQSRQTDETARLLHAALAALEPNCAGSGEHDSCGHTRGSRVEARRRAFHAAFDRYDIPPLDAGDARLSTLRSGRPELIAQYAHELCIRSSEAGAPGAVQGGWRFLTDDDPWFQEARGYDLDLLDFVRSHIEQMASADISDEQAYARVFETYEITKALGDGGGLLLFLKAIEKYLPLSAARAQVTSPLRRRTTSTFQRQDSSSDEDGLIAPLLPVCPKPIDDANVNLLNAVRYAAQAWGTPATLLTAPDQEDNDNLLDESSHHKIQINKKISYDPNVRSQPFTATKIHLKDDRFVVAEVYDATPSSGLNAVSKKNDTNNRPSCPRLLAFLTELLLRLPDEAFDAIFPPHERDDELPNLDTPLDIWAIKYQNWSIFAHANECRPCVRYNAAHDLNEGQALAISEPIKNLLTSRLHKRNSWYHGLLDVVFCHSQITCHGQAAAFSCVQEEAADDAFGIVTTRMLMPPPSPPLLP